MPGAPPDRTSSAAELPTFHDGVAMMRVSNILVPVDFSTGSKACLWYATAMAESLHSNVTLVHVFERGDLMATIVPGADNAVDDEVDGRLAQRRLEGLRAETPSRPGVDVRVVVVHGNAAEQIVSFSGKGAFNMVVMGTHGRTGVRRVLMGSVAEAVVRRASCPVLTLHFPNQSARPP